MGQAFQTQTNNQRVYTLSGEGILGVAWMPSPPTIKRKSPRALLLGVLTTCRTCLTRLRDSRPIRPLWVGLRVEAGLPRNDVGAEWSPLGAAVGWWEGMNG
jgi:hypothetical protein